MLEARIARIRLAYMRPHTKARKRDEAQTRSINQSNQSYGGPEVADVAPHISLSAATLTQPAGREFP